MTVSQASVELLKWSKALEEALKIRDSDLVDYCATEKARATDLYLFAREEAQPGCFDV